MKLLLVIIAKVLFLKGNLADRNILYETDESLWKDFVTRNCSTASGWKYNTLTNSFDTCADADLKCILLNPLGVNLFFPNQQFKGILMNMTMLLKKRNTLQLRTIQYITSAIPGNKTCHNINIRDIT